MGDGGITSFWVLEPKNATFSFMLLFSLLLVFLWTEEQEPINQKDDNFMIITVTLLCFFSYFKERESESRERKLKNWEKGCVSFWNYAKECVRKLRNWREKEGKFKEDWSWKGSYVMSTMLFVMRWWLLDATYILLVGMDSNFYVMSVKGQWVVCWHYR